MRTTRRELAVKMIVALLTVTSLTLGRAQQDSTAVLVTWAWTPPECGPGIGSCADHYELQINTDNTGWITVATPTDTFATVTMPEGSSRVRVRAVDIEEREGPWSEETLYNNWGPPGGCSFLHIVR